MLFLLSDILVRNTFSYLAYGLLKLKHTIIVLHRGVTWVGDCLACRFALKPRPFAAGAGRSGELSGFQTVFQDLVEIVSVGFLGALDHVDNP